MIINNNGYQVESLNTKATLMKSNLPTASEHNLLLIKSLTFMMFLMFAMTTDAVGVIIPEVIREFGLSYTAAGSFHYAPMIAIALSGIFFGFLSDKMGRKTAILIGLMLFGLTCFLFAAGHSFGAFLALLMLSGTAIGIFKTAALALIGDISNSTQQHTSTMNTVEGFFGVGAIIGPAIVTYLLNSGVSWKYLYVLAGGICVLLFFSALLARYPQSKKSPGESINLKRTLKMMKNPFALGFSLAIALYVATEVAIYVWMPMLLLEYNGSAIWFAAYALTIFFVLRAGGRFLGSWVLSKCDWSIVMLYFSLAIFLCYLGSMVFGIDAAVFLLPLSGLFMSMIYPTLNSKGISCFKKSEHGAIAGVILFFTAAAAAIGPLLMGAVGDIFGHVRYGFFLATGFSGLLFLGMLYNWHIKPAERLLAQRDGSEYDQP
jgi:MFS transporter, DHA1 family, quinolone resistance protein